MLEKLIKEVEAWAGERGIYKNSTAIKQLKITAEEVVEAAQALEYLALIDLWEHTGELMKRSGSDRSDAIEGAKEELGDIGVTWINACKAAGFTVEECLRAAHDKNMKRTKGKMINGKWVKEQ